MSVVYDGVLSKNWLKYIIVKTIESITKNKQLNISSVKMSLNFLLYLHDCSNCCMQHTIPYL